MICADEVVALAVCLHAEVGDRDPIRGELERIAALEHTVAQHGHQIGHGRETEVAIQRVGELDTKRVVLTHATARFVKPTPGARFDEWKSEDDLTMRITMPPRSPLSPRKHAVRSAGAPAPRGALARGQSENAIRERLHEAIERMPLSDLLRLLVPVE